MRTRSNPGILEHLIYFYFNVNHNSKKETVTQDTKDSDKAYNYGSLPGKDFNP